MKRCSTYVVWLGLMGGAVAYSLLMMKFAPGFVDWLNWPFF